MTQLVRHYLVDRDNPSVFATTPEHFTRPMFGTMGPDIEGLEIVHTLTDGNGIQFFLSNCPDTTTINEVEGLSVLTQAEWDAEIAAYDARQEGKRWNSVRKYRDELLAQTDWVVIKSREQGNNLDAAFKNWRQSLRDLPGAATFPLSLPAAPERISVNQETYDAYVAELRGVHMINDPLPALEAPTDN